MISIVDDDECARKAIEGLVRSLGYTVATYASAEDFLDSQQFNDTSCLITDVHLPGLSGVELHRRLLADGLRMQVLAAGAVGFLTKPFGQKSLIDCLKTALIRQDADIVRH